MLYFVIYFSPDAMHMDTFRSLEQAKSAMNAWLEEHPATATSGVNIIKGECIIEK